jgi:protein gp37
VSDGTHIEWTDATWNVVNGCTIVSHGCEHCYAMRLAATRLKHHPSRAGLARIHNGHPQWTGSVTFNNKVLLDPLRWRRPRKIFVCAHGDLFHENVASLWIDHVFAVIAAAPRHVFQVLTKRPERLREYAEEAMGCGEHWLAHCERSHAPMWPLPNVWLGVSVEDQKRADERVPVLLDTPAAVRWLSCEPLLGPVDLASMRACRGCPGCSRLGRSPLDPISDCWTKRIDWVVAGGESGPGARPMHPDWARSLRDQCAAAGVPFLFKQWGEWAPSTPEQAKSVRSGWRTLSGDRATGPNFSELYPENGAAFVEAVGKKRAGRLLDGVQHDGYPA